MLHRLKRTPSSEVELSVLMPAKNAATTIDIAVRSALVAMPKTGSELLVLLDDCTDNTLEVLKKITDPRLRVLNPGGKFGITNARNFLLSNSKGRYIAVLDADDIALPWRFRSQLRSLQKGYDFVCGTALIFGKSLKPAPLVPQLPLPLNSRQFPLMLTVSNPVVHSSSAFRKDAVTDLGGYPGTWPKEDYNLWIKLALSGARMKRNWFPNCLYRFHESQTTKTSTRNKNSEIDNAIARDIAELASVLGLARDRKARLGVVYKSIPLARIEHFGLGGINSRKRVSYCK